MTSPCLTRSVLGLKPEVRQVAVNDRGDGVLGVTIYGRNFHFIRAIRVGGHIERVVFRPDAVLHSTRLFATTRGVGDMRADAETTNVVCESDFGCTAGPADVSRPLGHLNQWQRRLARMSTKQLMEHHLLRHLITGGAPPGRLHGAFVRLVGEVPVDQLAAVLVAATSKYKYWEKTERDNRVTDDELNAEGNTRDRRLQLQEKRRLSDYARKACAKESDAIDLLLTIVAETNIENKAGEGLPTRRLISSFRALAEVSQGLVPVAPVARLDFQDDAPEVAEEEKDPHAAAVDGVGQLGGATGVAGGSSIYIASSAVAAAEATGTVANAAAVALASTTAVATCGVAAAAIVLVSAGYQAHRDWNMDDLAAGLRAHIALAKARAAPEGSPTRTGFDCLLRRAEAWQRSATIGLDISSTRVVRGDRAALEELVDPLHLTEVCTTARNELQRLESAEEAKEEDDNEDPADAEARRRQMNDEASEHLGRAQKQQEMRIDVVWRLLNEPSVVFFTRHVAMSVLSGAYHGLMTALDLPTMLVRALVGTAKSGDRTGQARVVWQQTASRFEQLGFYPEVYSFNEKVQLWFEGLRGTSGTATGIIADDCRLYCQVTAISDCCSTYNIDWQVSATYLSEHWDTVFGADSVRSDSPLAGLHPASRLDAAHWLVSILCIARAFQQIMEFTLPSGVYGLVDSGKSTLVDSLLHLAHGIRGQAHAPIVGIGASGRTYVPCLYTCGELSFIDMVGFLAARAANEAGEEPPEMHWVRRAETLAHACVCMWKCGERGYASLTQMLAILRAHGPRPILLLINQADEYAWDVTSGRKKHRLLSKRVADLKRKLEDEKTTVIRELHRANVPDIDQLHIRLGCGETDHLERDRYIRETIEGLNAEADVRDAHLNIWLPDDVYNWMLGHHQANNADDPPPPPPAARAAEDGNANGNGDGVP